MFDQIDGRIFELSLSNISNPDYLFNFKPEGFYFASWLLFISILSIIISLILTLIFKKRREKLYVEKYKRKIFYKHARLSLIFSFVLLLFVLLRSQGVNFLSMPFWLYLSLLLIIVNIIFSIFKANNYLKIFNKFKKKNDDLIENSEVVKSNNSYADYLPKKKKK